MFFVKFGCSIGIFLNSAHLICRSTDISKCFRGSPRLRDNEIRLYNFISKSACKYIAFGYLHDTTRLVTQIPKTTDVVWMTFQHY